MLRACLPVTVLLMGCPNVTLDTYGPGTGSETGDPDSGETGDADTDTDTDTDTDSGGDTSIFDESFDEPGDLVGFEDSEGLAQIDLTDASGDSNQGQEFYLVVVNTAEADIGYRLRYFDASSMERPSLPVRGSNTPSITPPPPIGQSRPTAVPPPAAELGELDIGVAHDEFLVRSDLESTTDYATVNTTLWALGDNVSIWVDRDVPIDWDVDCDGTVEFSDGRDAFGFDNCDLADVAEIIDTNIIPNVRALYGDESDIDGDGRIAIVITPVLNSITLTSTEEEDYSTVLKSYAEPSVDLTDFHYLENPGSDEQEVIYVFAPDPYSFYNDNVGPAVEEYTGYQLAAQVARSFTTLVSYNQHYILLEAAGSENATIEDDWVNDLLGSFAAEYCGFGAAFYQDAWEYLDAPHRFSLAADAQRGSLTPASRGAQYLFGLWLYEQAEAASAGAGVTTMTSIMQSETTGTASIEAGTGGTMADLVLGWQVALLTSGVTTSSGDPLVDPAEWAPYPLPVTISAPPASPGGFYGANGYQRGVNLRGTNEAFRYGHTDSPEAISGTQVKLEGQDAYQYVPGFEFLGWIDSHYGAQVVRLSGISYDAAIAEIQSTDTGLVGAVVRWNDPTFTDLAVENSASATEINAVELPALPDDGTPIYGVGQIIGTSSVDSISSDGAEEVDIPDTDRWLLDLTDRSSAEDVEVIVWLDRHFSSTDGDMGPSDPWVAIVPLELVPQPTVDGTNNATCADGLDFAFPTSLLDHLVSQLYLSSTMWDEDSDDDFDPCGDQSDAATVCAEDWDRDGVLDEDEPLPETFLTQARVMECTQNGNVPPAAWAYNSDWLDVDEMDEDELATGTYTYNAGGRSGTDGEEGFVWKTLEGGRQYLIVVGASADDVGTYEVTVREVP